MRRFSQRNSLVTLNDINITPLLDLAFVLLIIFVITTPLLEKGLDLKLPQANGQPDKQIRKEDIRTVEISNTGVYVLNKQRFTIQQLTDRLVADFHANPNLVIYIRSDRKAPMEYFVAVMDACQKNGITRYSVRTEPVEAR
ncbi:MAG TPA: biopolymer transporter ExbD [Verrucomicrobiae bacterium]|jgi:biopolymer transport protein ExbD|nr:biopolymer transporter ExbD [Verrucomicrobiae bacterium]